ncbi:MAG: GNAT family protein [Candidatus Poribacteria bacterium]|nr:GNAT family protein [Candidatus Poribacteria bacterium]
MIEFRPLAPPELPRLIEWSPTPTFLMLWSGPFFSFPLDMAQLKTYFASTQTDPPIAHVWTAWDGGDPVGNIELGNLDKRKKTAHISRVVVDPTRNGRGYGGAMMRFVVEFGFKTLQLDTITLGVIDFNLRAIRLYERLGFVKEARYRDSCQVGAGYWNHYVMRLTRQRWEDRA